MLIIFRPARGTRLDDCIRNCSIDLGQFKNDPDVCHHPGIKQADQYVFLNNSGLLDRVVWDYFILILDVIRAVETQIRHLMFICDDQILVEESRNLQLTFIWLLPILITKMVNKVNYVIHIAPFTLKIHCWIKTIKPEEMPMTHPILLPRPICLNLQRWN